MVKIGLQIKATLENIEALKTNHESYAYLLKVKCLGCGEVSDKFHDVIASEKVPLKTGRGDANFIKKCKLCGRENNMDIIEGTTGKYLSDDQGKFKTIVAFDCRGMEPTEFQPASGWIAVAMDSGKVFDDVDLSEKEWADYDDVGKQSVGVYEIESQFVKLK